MTNATHIASGNNHKTGNSQLLPVVAEQGAVVTYQRKGLRPWKLF